ncbi:MAG: GNAT family N-acetyltransferase [bacterium]
MPSGDAESCGLNNGVGNIIVTGHNRDAVQNVFHHAENISNQVKTCLHWMSPDQLLSQQPECDLLLIDEAACIHLHKLENILRQYPRIAMATTVHGYEGTGRGFMLRFHTLLDRLTRGWKQVPLNTPIRWSTNDPLEQLINNLLVLDAELPVIVPEESLHKDCQFEKLDSSRLCDDEKLLREVFSLLVLAHYKTRPKDLQLLLDNQNLQIYRLAFDTGSGTKTVAVALLVDEGVLNQKDSIKIFTGDRRPPGHVVAEILASQLGLPHAATLSMGRIMRVVVHPDWQRHGFGTQLVTTICNSPGLSFDLIGTNFSLANGLAGFWRKCGFSPVRIGLTKSSEGGSNSALYLLPRSESGRATLQQARQSFARNLTAQTRSVLRNVEPEILAEVLLGDQILLEDLDEQSLLDAAGYCFGIRPAESISSTLTRVALNGLVLNQISEPELVVERLLQGKCWQNCSGLDGDQGRRQGSQRIHSAIVDYLNRTYRHKLEAARKKLIEGSDPVH